jgi:hypothetical protein
LYLAAKTSEKMNGIYGLTSPKCGGPRNQDAFPRDFSFAVAGRADIFADLSFFARATSPWRIVLGF